jgi:branched-chain amino acid aminotransferase
MSLSPATSALHYGQAIFEGMKAFAAGEEIHFFRPRDNWSRLNTSARRMVMPEIPENLFMKGLNTLVGMDRAWVPTAEGSSLYIRPFMFATDDFIGVKPSTRYRFVIFCCPVGPYYNKPLRVKVEEEFSRSAPGGTGFAKCAGNYGGSLLATQKAQQEGFDQVLWTDPMSHQFVEETGTTNFFAVIGNRVVTPALGITLLAGITRDSVIQIIRDMGIVVEERPLTVAELKEAHRNGEVKELFITGTAATLINLEAFGHQNQYFDVYAKGDTSLSTAVKQTLDNIKYGLIHDKFNWCETLESTMTESV